MSPPWGGHATLLRTAEYAKWTAGTAPFMLFRLDHFPWPRRPTTFELTLPRAATRRARPTAGSTAPSAPRSWRAACGPGARLPGTRDLARQYGLSRGTIVNAFEQLKSEGYVEGSVGSGTYVSRALPDELLRGRRPARSRRRRPAAAAPRVSRSGRRVAAFPVLETARTRAFRANLPALDLFPTTLWAQLTRAPASARLDQSAARLRADGLPAAAGGGGRLPEHLARREVPARAGRDRLRRAGGARPGGAAVPRPRAIACAWRIRATSAPRSCSRPPGARIVAGCRVDDEGMKPRDARLRGARLAYVTPAHQFPLGITMSLPRRLALLEWARARPAR